MKTIYSNSDLIHAFANRNIESGRNSTGSLFLASKGKEIYSYGYHYLLSEHLNNSTVLINDTGYSATTGKHISMVRNAVSHKKRFYYSQCEIKAVSERVKELLKKLATARKPELYIDPIKNLINAFFEYQKYVRENDLKKFKYDLRGEKVRYLKRVLDNVEAAAKGLVKEVKRAQALARKRNQKRLQAEKNKALENVKRFKDGKIGYIYGRILGEDFLRLSNDLQHVQTSQGVAVSLSDFVKLAKAFKRGVDIVGRSISNYRVNAQNKNFVKVGCHTIYKSEVDYILDRVSILNKKA